MHRYSYLCSVMMTRITGDSLNLYWWLANITTQFSCLLEKKHVTPVVHKLYCFEQCNSSWCRLPNCSCNPRESILAAVHQRRKVVDVHRMQSTIIQTGDVSLLQLSHFCVSWPVWHARTHISIHINLPVSGTKDPDVDVGARWRLGHQSRERTVDHISGSGSKRRNSVISWRISIRFEAFDSHLTP